MKGSHGHVLVLVSILEILKRLIFCESVIDMMTYYQLYFTKSSVSDVRLVSMEGLKLSVIAYQTLRLAAEEQGKLAFLQDSKTQVDLAIIFGNTRDDNLFSNSFKRA